MSVVILIGSGRKPQAFCLLMLGNLHLSQFFPGFIGLNRLVCLYIEIDGVGFSVIPSSPYAGIATHRMFIQDLNLRAHKLLCLTAFGVIGLSQIKTGINQEIGLVTFFECEGIERGTFCCGDFHLDATLLISGTVIA